jgi:hypothetical protein
VRAILKRVRMLEQNVPIRKQLLVLQDFDGLYYGECGRGLSDDQFNAWLNMQKDYEVLVVCWGKHEEVKLSA